VAETTPLEQFTAEIIKGLAAGKAVEVDGLGVFYTDARKGFRFEPVLHPQVFIAYAKEDREVALRLYAQLAGQGFRPWMDVRKLMPGQNWPRAIENAIELSDFFVACFSSESVHKHGGFQAELRYALDCARHAPLDDIFMVPVRLDCCRVPRAIQRETQYVDLFPDWEPGVERLIGTLRAEWARRSER
jgi:hypothetical protein